MTNKHKRILHRLSHTYQPSVSLRGMCLRGAWDQMRSVMCSDTVQWCCHLLQEKCNNNSIVLHFFIFFLIFFFCVIWFAYFLLVAFSQPTKKSQPNYTLCFLEIVCFGCFFGVNFLYFFLNFLHFFLNFLHFKKSINFFEV